MPLPINLGIQARYRIHTYCLVSLYALKPPEIPTNLTISNWLSKLLSPWCHHVRDKHWWKRKQTKPKHRWKRDWGNFFFLHTCFLEHVNLEPQDGETYWGQSSKASREKGYRTKPTSGKVTQLIPNFPFCGDPCQESPVTGNYGKTRYKSAKQSTLYHCLDVMLMHSTGFWNLRPSWNVNMRTINLSECVVKLIMILNFQC